MKTAVECKDLMGEWCRDTLPIPTINHKDNCQLRRKRRQIISPTQRIAVNYSSTGDVGRFFKFFTYRVLL